MKSVSDIIARKRDGHTLTSGEIAQIVDGLTDGVTVGDAQAGAFAMAVLLNGMTAPERVTLTTAMRDSGDVLSWDLPGPVVDKHSTGGIGDTVSLMLAPALAACGAYVPMISGRGLGHTGGTLDKLDAIPGYQCQPDQDRLRQVVRDIGCAIIGQTANLAPADRRLYAIRDVTATVESIDLIAASILSKKLAEGLDALILDVKVGRGAFMQTPEKARDLATALCDTANGGGCPTMAVLTDMNAPLGNVAGNALEVMNAVQFLRGDEIDSRLWDVTVTLGGALLALAGLAAHRDDGMDRISAAFQSGAAATRFQAMVASLGGPADLIDAPERYLTAAPVIRDVTVKTDGFVTDIDTRAIGMAVVALGGGRTQPEQTIDHRTGFDWLMGLGQRADGDTPIARVHAADADSADAAVAAIRAAYAIGDIPPEEPPLIIGDVT